MRKSNEGQKEGPSQTSNGQQKQPLARQMRMKRGLEIATAIILGVVAVATAWSGYQAARWAGEQSTRYAQANALHVRATRDWTLAGQAELYDVSLFNEWLNAHLHDETALARIDERLFRSEFRPAFEAWLAKKPFNNPNTPPAPFFMPQYKFSQAEQADRLEAEATKTFDVGQVAGDRSETYVLNTVLLAVALFLAAISEHFQWLWIKAVILVLALGMLLLSMCLLAMYPII